MTAWLSKQYFNQIKIYIPKYRKLWWVYGKQIIPYLKWAKTEVFYTSGFLPRFWNICLNFASYTSLIWKPEIYNILKSKSCITELRFLILKISFHTKSGILIKPSHSPQGSVTHSCDVSYHHKTCGPIHSHMHIHNKWYQPSLGDGVKGNFYFHYSFTYLQNTSDTSRHVTENFVHVTENFERNVWILMSLVSISR